MTDPNRLAALHATGFEGPALWSPEAFAEAQTQPACFYVPEGGHPNGFALGRVIAGEAELLTLIVAPHLRGTGEGRHLLASFEDEARDRGATTAFLEVRADNQRAIRLYRRAGWTEVGKRDGYYDGTDALVLRKWL